MFLDIDKIKKLEANPNYLADLIHSVGSKNDFDELAPFFNTPERCRLLLLNASPKIIEYCQQESGKTKNELLSKEVNLLSQIISSALSDLDHHKGKNITNASPTRHL